MPICTKCGLEKDVESFGKSKDRRLRHCRDCATTRALAWAKENPERAREHTRSYQKNHPERVKENVRRYRKNNTERIKESNQCYRKKNQNQRREYNRNWRKNNPDKCRERLALYRGGRRAIPSVKLLENLRVRINKALRGKTKSEATQKLIGCPVELLCLLLESQFQAGMTWANYGPVWHVDHVRPCASFNLSDPEQQRKCFHWSNLQPLWAEKNFRKGAKCLS